MSGWGDTHRIRINALSAEIKEQIAALNAKMLHLPPRFQLRVNEDGRDLTLAEDEIKEG